MTRTLQLMHYHPEDPSLVTVETMDENGLVKATIVIDAATNTIRIYKGHIKQEADLLTQVKLP